MLIEISPPACRAYMFFVSVVSIILITSGGKIVLAAALAVSLLLHILGVMIKPSFWSYIATKKTGAGLIGVTIAWLIVCSPIVTARADGATEYILLISIGFCIALMAVASFQTTSRGRDV
jgi:hypothetical protein